jgi:hypothetical protein
LTNCCYNFQRVLLLTEAPRVTRFVYCFAISATEGNRILDMKRSQHNETMKHCYTMWMAVLLFLGLGMSTLAPEAQAQLPRIHHSVVKEKNKPPQMGRDLWFMLLTNYGADLGGKYFALYVTSPNVTNVHVQLSSGLQRTINIQPYKTAAFNIPLAWETRSSGRVEDMAIHVWSNNADICCYVMCHNAYTSDGFYVYPNIGWGTEYVVAGYASLFEGGGTYVYDLPSQFGIISNTDLTRVTITPTVDLRVEPSPGSNCSAIYAQKGQATQLTLNRGQCIQFRSTCTQDCDNYDLTGTVIKSNFPVGVICGSQCPNIPCDFPYCDHVVEMVPPVRMWAQTYYTVPFYQPPGASLSHAASTFLVIASKDNQKIYRFDANQQSENLYCALNKYQTYWRNDIAEGSRWRSDAPFLLVQYINSASYPDNVNGQGDPAEVVVPPVEQFTKTAVFQLPISVGTVTPYTNYVNIIANINDKKILLDGVSIMAKSTRVLIDDKYIGYRMSNLQTGGHKVESDSGVGVYIYGYGFDESYGWTGNFANGTFNSPDTIPPQVDTIGQCTAATVNVVDTMYGLSWTQPATGIESGLYFTTVDSQLNMSYALNPQWSEGTQQASSYYNMYVMDPSKEAILIVSYYDQASNKTTITSTYKPQDAKLSPPLTDFGIGNATNCTIMYDTLRNIGEAQYPYNTLKLLLGNQGFTIDTTYSKNSLGVGETRLIRICFKPVTGNTVFDTLMVDDGCNIQKVVLTGSGGLPDFYVTGHDFGTVNKGVKTAPYSVKVHNTSNTQPITIDSMFVDNETNFIGGPHTPPTGYWIVLPKDSATIAPGKDLLVPFVFDAGVLPDGQIATNWHAHSSDIQTGKLPVNDPASGWRSAKLSATVVSPSVAIGSNQSISVDCVDPTKDTIPLSFTITASGTNTSNIVDVRHADGLNFTPFKVYRSNGNEVSLVNMNEQLQPGSTLTILDTIILPMQRNADYYDTINAYYLDPSDGSKKLVPGSPILVDVHAIYRSGDLTPHDANSNDATVTFAPVAFQSAKVQQVLTFTDTVGQPMEITNIFADPNSPYKGSFTWQADQTLPYTLQPNGKLTITITFDPSVSYDETQTIFFDLKTPQQVCNAWRINATAQVVVKGAQLLGFKSGNYSTCESPIDTITVQNTMPDSPSGDVPYTIQSATFQSGANFAFTNGSPVGQTVHSNSTLKIPVTFMPTQVSGSNTYNDVVLMTLHDQRKLNPDTSIQIAISNTATTTGITATAGAGTVKIDQNFVMPIAMSQNKNGLSEDISNRNITEVVYTFQYNSDLLDMSGGIGSVFDPGSNGWTFDAAKSSFTAANPPALSTLKLALVPKGGTLTDANLATVGNLKFHVNLTSDSDHTPIQLVSTDLLDASGKNVTGCVTPTSISGDFTAQLICGDSTLRKVMNGIKDIDIIRPATPDPVVGNTLTISYANRAEGVTTLSIFDALGKEVTRPLDGVHQGGGAWQVPCDVSNLPSGTYTYRLSQGKSVISKQFVIQR